MDSARADALAARSHLAAQGWIARQAESFRHLPPPEAALWLGDADAACDASPLEGGWKLHPMLHTPRASVAARWLDAADPAQRTELLAGLPPPGDDEAAPFAWAHRALVRQGLRLRVGAATGETGMAWLHLERRPSAAVEAPLLVIELQPGARCVLLESHERDGGGQPAGCGHGVVQNLQVHIRLGAGASLRHLRIALPGADDRIAHQVQVRLDRDAQYEQCLLAGGSGYHLQRGVIDLQGARAAGRSSAVLLAAGAALEQQTRLLHHAAHTRSAVDALALGSGTARLVANAYSFIAAGSDEADTRQRLTGIPTSGQPKLVLRPHLEIQHDAVQAAHGATWGALPPEALFHARQRGLDERAAMAMIIQGLAGAVFDRGITQPGLLEALGVEAMLARAVGRHLAAGDRQQGEHRHG
jgi:Fe-S cluster assembly protein SufD